ncbi:MAG: hypothetical protein QOH57_1611 [Mycobacterium sp.]|nr:hypothetical protein [Mycobacterium sp.]
MRLDITVFESTTSPRAERLRGLFTSAGCEPRIERGHDDPLTWGGNAPVVEVAGVRALRLRPTVHPLAPVPPPYVVDVVVEAIPWIAAVFAAGAAAFAGGAVAKAGEDTWDAFRDGGWKGLQQLVRGIGRAYKPPAAAEAANEETDWEPSFSACRRST